MGLLSKLLAGIESRSLADRVNDRFITPWVIKSGFIPPIMTNMSLITLWCLFGILFYYKGKTFRRWSRNSSVHKL